MRKLTLLIFGFLAFFLVVGTLAHAQADETVKCAVSGKEVGKSEAKGPIEYKGNTYYFCCDNCKKAFEADPEKYLSGEGHAEELHAGHHQAEQVSDTAVDPVCGMKVKKVEAAATLEYEGNTYYFCMEGCKEKFLKDPAQYLKSDDELVKCPVMGHDVKKSEAVGPYVHDDKTYYFCCADCKEKFIADPDKYLKK